MSMTENEAKKTMEVLRHNLKVEHMTKDMWDGSTKEEVDTYIETFDCYSQAIQALEEIQQYRAIGTVEEFEELLEYRAIGSVDKIKGSIETNYVLLHAYEEIGTIDEFKALKEKERADKAMNNSTWGANKEISVNWQ